MVLFEHENIRLQAALDAANAEVNTQQQALAAAQASVSAAQTRVADEQAKLPTLQAAAAAADQRVAQLNAQIDAHAANEPEPTIEDEGGRRPRPNPAWRIWKRQMDQLVAQREQAQSSADAAHAALDGGQRAVVQVQMELQSAERQVNQIIPALQEAQTVLKAAQNQVAQLEQWRAEIERDPLARSALELSAAELSARAMSLDESLSLARFSLEDAERHFAALLARRDQLSVALDDFNRQIFTAQNNLPALQAAANAASSELFDFLDAGQ